MFERSIVTTLVNRLGSERRFLQALVGPRQVGKTTAVLQAGSRLEAAGVGFVFASGDEPLLPGPAWIDEQWEVARAASSGGPVVLALDEIHKLSGWADRVKANWDRDTRSGTDVRLVVLGSSPLLVGRRLGESLAGRFGSSRPRTGSGPSAGRPSAGTSTRSSSTAGTRGRLRSSGTSLVGVVTCWTLSSRRPSRGMCCHWGASRSRAAPSALLPHMRALRAGGGLFQAPGTTP